MTTFDPSLPRPGADTGKPADDPVYAAKATKAAVEFESFFIANMLKQMRAGTREMAAEDSVFKDPVNRDMQDMADGMMATQMAGQRAFGIADAILRQLLPPKA
jgi:flagellar protein FlgJ